MNLVFYFYVKCYEILCECDIIFDINRDVWKGLIFLCDCVSQRNIRGPLAIIQPLTMREIFAVMNTA